MNLMDRRSPVGLYRCLNFAFLYPEQVDAMYGLQRIKGLANCDPGGYLSSVYLEGLMSNENCRLMAEKDVKYLNHQLFLPVHLIVPPETLLVVRTEVIRNYPPSRSGEPETEEVIHQVVAGEKIGWIIPRRWMIFQTLKRDV